MNQILYEMQPLSDPSVSGREIDILFMACGSDHRAYEAARKVISNHGRILNTLAFDFEERSQQLALNDEYYNFRSLALGKTREVKCSIKDPESCLHEMLSYEADFMTAKNIAMDISCFTKPFFFYLLKLMRERFHIQSIDILYTEPLSYIFPGKLFTTYRSSSGPIKVLEIPGYVGYEERDDKRLLVILLGFDGDLSREINEEISPAETVVVNGFPAYVPKFKDISIVANERLTSNKDAKITYSRANNPFEVFNLLEKIRKENPKAFINVAPLGTKPMALGACLFALQDASVRVVYPFPESYEKITTHKCWDSWRYEVPLTI